ncbi:testis-specific protein 10-interacting protein [Tiliqua scincoides]|uniref:testis-specific protein 10-interacting protein n=1 Tax=Tiliqua scincoides TaxID=71010 RepID=UPI003461FDEC
MLSPHRQSVLTNACIQPSVDPLTRTPGTIYEPKGQVRLLGLLSETNPPQQEEYLDAGDGMLICMKRTKKRSRNSARKGCWDPKKVPNVCEASDTEQESNQNRQVDGEMVEGPVFPTAPNLSPISECPREPRPGSFPFHWMWESISVKGQALYQDCSPARAKDKQSTQASSTSVHDPPCTPAPSSGSTVEQLVSSTKESSSLEETRPPGPPENPLYKHQKLHQHAGLPPGSALLPLYWKIEARSEARKQQLRQERRRWLQLTQQLLNLESQAPRQEKHLSAKQVEDKLRAELLCLATEPKEPGPQREKSRAKSTKKEPVFQPTINHKVPNFKGLQRRFQEQLEHRKDQAKLTVCKPFRIHSTSSSQLPSGSKEEDPEDSFNEVCQLWRVHWRAQSCPNFDLPVGAPIMPTKASSKRQQANRLLLMEWEKREQQEKRRAEQRRTKEQQVQQEVAKCLAAYRNPGRSSGSFQRRREELRRQEKQRMDEYTLQLQEMRDRVESRPYLFERVMQANARQAVERRFSQVLSALGIDEELLWKHAVRQAAGKSSTKIM